jgi:hypothetical protein
VDLGARAPGSPPVGGFPPGTSDASPHSEVPPLPSLETSYEMLTSEMMYFN